MEPTSEVFDTYQATCSSIGVMMPVTSYSRTLPVLPRLDRPDSIDSTRSSHGLEYGFFAPLARSRLVPKLWLVPSSVSASVDYGWRSGVIVIQSMRPVIPV